MVPGFISFLPHCRIEMEGQVEEANSACGGQNGQEAQKGPPAEPVLPQEKKAPAKKESRGGVEGTDVFFHGRFGFGPTIRLAAGFRCASFGKSLPDLARAGRAAKP